MVVLKETTNLFYCVDAAAREAASEPRMETLKETWLPIAKDWREKQLRYSWLCTMMGKHDDLWELTTLELETTLEEHCLFSDDKIRNRLLSLNTVLSVFGEVPDVLANLKVAGHRFEAF